MKICIVSHSASDGGAERVLLEAVDALCEAGAECVVVFPCPGPLVQAVASRGVECKVLHYGWWIGRKGGKSLWVRLRSARSYLTSTVRLVAYLARNRCDMVVTNTIAVPAGGLAAWIARLPHVWWIHEFGEEDHGFDFDLGKRFSLWLVGRSSSLLVANSLAVARKYKSLMGPQKIHTLYCNVHVDPARAVSHPGIPLAAGRRICIVGRISESKGQQDAIRALEELRRNGTDVSLLIIGPASDYSRELRELSLRLGLGDWVHFTGYVSNPLPIVSSCDVAVVCSRCEAFGLVTVEAMKLGKPVVGTRAGGTTELIEDGVNGFLYTPGDYVDLASKLQVLLGDDDLRRRMGESARSWSCRRFTRARFREDLLRLLSLATSGSDVSAAGDPLDSRN